MQPKPSCAMPSRQHITLVSPKPPSRGRQVAPETPLSGGFATHPPDRDTDLGFTHAPPSAEVSATGPPLPDRRFWLASINSTVTADRYRHRHAPLPPTRPAVGSWPMTETDPTSAAVVWWRTSLALAEIPRRHIIGWSDISGYPEGTITISSPHPRLDRRTIETALAAELPATYSDLPRLGTVEELSDRLTAEARLRAAGHRVVTRQVTRVYGDCAVGGVVATLLGKGVDAYILIDREATSAARKAVCQTAEEALARCSSAP